MLVNTLGISLLNECTLLKRITATRGPLLAEATMNEGKRGIRRHRHFPKSTRHSMTPLDLSKNSSSSTLSDPASNGAAFFLPLFIQIEINKEVFPLLLSSSFKHF
jgi:hypothetical protein